MSSRKDIRPSSQIKKHQSPQKRTESPKTGREEKTRKMIREAKIITRPSLPAPVPGKPNLSHLLITLSRTQCDLCGGHGARGIASQWTRSNTVETGGTGRESSGSPWTPMRSCQNKKGRWKWREFKGVKQVAKWVGKTDCSGPE